MIRIAICDDEANTCAYLSSLIRTQSCLCEIVEYGRELSQICDVPLSE